MTAGQTPLEQEIWSDIQMRSESLLSIKTLTLRYDFLESDQNLLLQHSIPMVYSIWEGFVKTAFKIYIQELNKLGLTTDTVCKPILVYHIESKFKQLKQYPEKFENKASFFEELNKFYTSKVIDIDSKIDTKTDIDFNVLNKLLGKFNLEKIPDYPEPKYSLSGELNSFLTKRNNVVHQQEQGDTAVKITFLERVIKLVEKLMELVFERIISGFINKTYLVPIDESNLRR